MQLEDFNPTLVQLELPDFKTWLWFEKFQSHIGAIRIEKMQDDDNLYVEFQSHIGAIRIC